MRATVTHLHTFVYGWGVTTPRSTRPRLAAKDWVTAALELVRTDGMEAVTINRLCEHLGVTRGSFYWHFADLDALREAITEHWCAETRAVLDGLVHLELLPPVERLRAMTLRLVDERSASVERALRDWARTDVRVADAVAAADLFVFGTVQGALLELGHEPLEARQRAGLLVYAGLGFAHGHAALPVPTAEEIERLLALVALQGL